MPEILAVEPGVPVALEGSSLGRAASPDREIRSGGGERESVAGPKGEDNPGTAWAETLSNADLREEQLRDPEVGTVLRWREKDNERPEWKEIRSPGRTTLTLWQQWADLRVQQGALYRAKERDPEESCGSRW